MKMEKEKDLRNITNEEELDISGGQDTEFKIKNVVVEPNAIKTTMLAYGGPMPQNKLLKYGGPPVRKETDSKLKELLPDDFSNK